MRGLFWGLARTWHLQRRLPQLLELVGKPLVCQPRPEREIPSRFSSGELAPRLGGPLACLSKGKKPSASTREFELSGRRFLSLK